MARLVIAMFAAAVLTACGAKEGKKSDDASQAVDLPWTEVHLILQKNCGACHTEGAKHSAFVDDKDLFVAEADAVAERLKSTEPKVQMPPSRTRDALSDADRTTVLTYLNRL